jgi:DNA-binding transcriptional ArsR family regulator
MNADVILKALANPVRREILTWLKHPEQHFPDQEMPHSLGVCAGQIDQKIGLSVNGAFLNAMSKPSKHF